MNGATKLNYNVNQPVVPAPTPKEQVSTAKTAISKQAVVNSAIASKLPGNPGPAAQVPPAQTVGFGRTR